MHYVPNPPSGEGEIILSTTLLSTAFVTLQGPTGDAVKARAFLDFCAEDSFLSQHLVQALALQRSKIEVVCSGLGGKTISTARVRVTTNLSAPDFTLSFWLTF